MIPQELIAFPHWIMWRAASKPNGEMDKLPLSPHTGGFASVTDPTTWANYAFAQSQAERFRCGLGFVLSNNDPFGFVDLDPIRKASDAKRQTILQRQLKISESFNTYQEKSPSGEGLHIVGCFNVPRGKKRDLIEIYSSGRFMTVTGDTYRHSLIKDCNELARILWEEIGGSENENVEVDEQPEKYDDQTIHRMGSTALNSEKFNHLWNGEWAQAAYTSQSEADFALIDILSYYSRNLTQIKRMFMRSGLGQRDKAKRRDYIDNMIRRSFDNQPPYIDLTEMIKNGEQQLKQSSVLVNPFAGPLFEAAPDATYEYSQPPGLLGEISQYIYDSSFRQVHEISLCAAIGLMAGVCGRSYNISNTGLNQYILLLAKTGAGKEGMVGGIDRIMSEVQKMVPASIDFLGPSAIASGQALIRHISRIPCFVSIVGEFGLYLQSLCAYNANSSLIMLRKTLLELYMKSGKNDVLRSSIYSDKDKNTPQVLAPSFSILGESTPQTFYGGLDEAMISQGLLPRFLTIQYDNKVPYMNEGHKQVRPDPTMIQKVADLATQALTLQASNRAIDVEMTDEALKFSREFSHSTTDNINQADTPVLQELWNRAHLKMLKLSALLAVGTNPYRPVIDNAMLKWSRQLVERDIKGVLRQFELGFVGSDTSEVQQISKVSHLIKEFLTRPYGGTFIKAGVSEQMFKDRVFPVGFLQKRLLSASQFKNDRIGANGALKRCVEMLIQDGAVRPVRPMDMFHRYQTSAVGYAIIDVERFLRE